ncbi:RidA family protein [Aestuariibius sp. 2305UL40-4]|uniref:RidA family protein n=1 Tax=Aestuariibius violaceus TaxID=3234132 RepID=UPI00345EE35D
MSEKKPLTPSGIAPPFGAYSHGILGPKEGRLLVTSGQLGMQVDGTVPDTLAGQAEICFRNIDATLAEAGADRSSILRLNAYVTRREDFPAYMEARDAWLADVKPKPASTLLVVSGFTREEFLVEVEATAWV